jgi:hypothetical protein
LSVISAAAWLSLSGCASVAPWDKPGATQAELTQDSTDCWRSTPRNGYFGSGIGASPTLVRQMQDVYEKCMTSRGYTQHSAR